MRKLFQLCLLFMTAFAVVSCSNEPTPDPTPVVRPEITLTQNAVEAESFTFDVTSTLPGTLGYIVVADGYDVPFIDNWFSQNTVEVDGSATITVENLNSNTSYTLYAALRAADGGTLSAPANLKFTTADGGDSGPIVINNIGYDNVTFSINLSGYMLFQCIDKAYLEHINQSVETYITTDGIGILDQGPIVVDWQNGGMYGNYEMRMRDDTDYYVIAVSCDKSKNITGEIFVKEFRTLRKPHSSAGVTTELLNITSTSVDIKTTPDNTVAKYYVYLDKASQIHMINDEYGEALLVSSVLKQISYGIGWELTTANEATWGNLLPSTEYSVVLIIVDNKEAQAVSIIDFTTTAPMHSAPEISLSITEPAENPHSTLNLNIYSEGATKAKIVFRPTADIVERRSETNYSDEQIVSNYGTELSAEQVAAIASTGLTITMDELWPEVEYTALVSIRNAENTETLKVTTYSTPAQAAAPRVESDLFTSLLGEWELTYNLYQENFVEVSVTDVVTIAQGVDDKSNADYRNQNRLVILGFPFAVSSYGDYTKLPVFTPADLLEARANYYAKGHNLIYRDYGPKIFLEINADGTIGVPSSKSSYLYNWGSEGYYNFYGCDFDPSRNENFTAPATFPVTISDDGNTLTIGAYHSGAEFGYGVYRPAVFLNESQFRACASSDIVLRRVQ